MSTLDQRAMRETISAHLHELGANQADLHALSESVLYDGPRRLAVIYRAGPLLALWDIPRTSIRFYDNCGCKLQTVHGVTGDM